MEATTHLSDVLALGKRLVDELDSDESRDSLAQWMVHHIAHLMRQAESVSAADRTALEAECRRAILELWSHRNSLHSSSRPFLGLDRILSTLEALDPESPSFFYFRQLNDQLQQEAQPDKSAEQWLSVAQAIDRGARTLIGYCIARAASDAADRTAQWIALAEKVGSSLDSDIQIVRVVLKNSALMNSIPPSDERKRALTNVLQRRVEALDQLVSASSDLRGQLIDRISVLESDAESDK